MQPDKDVGIYRDRQVAIVFELRHFKRYQEVTVRILLGLKEDWGSDPDKNKRILAEIDLTLKSLGGKST